MSKFLLTIILPTCWCEHLNIYLIAYARKIYSMFIHDPYNSMVQKVAKDPFLVFSQPVVYDREHQLLDVKQVILVFSFTDSQQLISTAHITSLLVSTVSTYLWSQQSQLKFYILSFNWFMSVILLWGKFPRIRDHVLSLTVASPAAHALPGIFGSDEWLTAEIYGRERNRESKPDKGRVQI